MGSELEAPPLILVISILLAAGPGSAAAKVLVLSRHSGEILAGLEAPIAWSGDSRLAMPLVTALGMVTNRTLAEAARILAASDRGGSTGFHGPGWNVQIGPDRIWVRTGPEPDPSPSASGGIDEQAEVQVFGLVGPERVSLQCPGNGVRVGSEITVLPRGWQTLASVLPGGTLFCTGGPWEVRVGDASARAYAGTFSWRPAPPRVPEPGATDRQSRARRGSDVVFTTTVGAYVAGVLAAEHRGLVGEARVALSRVVAHNLSASRHPGRAVCDTTHCQVFRGTGVPSAEDRRVLLMASLPGNGWLPFFRGGTSPWAARRPVGQVLALLGDVRGLSGDGKRLDVTSTAGTSTRPCEPVRSALRLPGCPRSADFEGQTVVFRGTGQGHGLGLDVEAAARSGLDARTLLERAYSLDLSD